MKAIYVFLLLGFTIFSVNPILSQSDEFIFFEFNSVYLSIKNEFLIDENVKYAPSYISYPYADRKINCYGPNIKIELLEKGSIENRKNKIFKGIRFSGWIIDSNKTNTTNFKLENTEFSISKEDKLIMPWQKIIQLKKSHFNQNINNDLAYTIFDNIINESETIKIEFRNNISKKKIITYFLYRPKAELFPFLANWSKGEAMHINQNTFIENESVEEIKFNKGTDSFYQYWPKSYGRGLKNEIIPANTKLTLNFRRPSPSFNDKSMEFCLLEGNNKDTLWIKTGHRIVLYNLATGKNYRLLIRYQTNPNQIQLHTFNVLPAWYQRPYFKFIILGLLILILIIIGFFIYRYKLKKIKQKNDTLVLELKSIRAQLNPHFIFNALSSIQSLVNKKDIERTNYYLTNFSTLLRETLENNEREMVSLKEEFNTLEKYLLLEQLRFNFKFNTSISPNIDTNAIEIPFLILQPYIENSIKHGIAVIGENGLIQINVERKINDLIITIVDNGKGFTSIHQKDGYGLKLSKDRLTLLNKGNKDQKILLNIESILNEGTTVYLTFKNWI